MTSFSGAPDGIHLVGHDPRESGAIDGCHDGGFGIAHRQSRLIGVKFPDSFETSNPLRREDVDGDAIVLAKLSWLLRLAACVQIEGLRIGRSGPNRFGSRSDYCPGGRQPG